MANKECKIWIMKKLFPEGIQKITGKEFEVKTKGRKKTDWAIESEDKKNVILIEDKETGDVSFEEAKKQVIAYSQDLINKYANIISIAVKQSAKTSDFNVAVYVNGLLKEDEKQNNLNPLDYYWSLVKHTFDKEKIIKNIGALNNTMHKLKIADNIRASIASTFLVCINKGMQITEDDDIESIKTKVYNHLYMYTKDETGEDLNKWKKIKTLFDTFCLDLKRQKSFLTASALFTVFKEIKYQVYEYIKDVKGMQGYDVMSLFFTTFSKAALSNDKGQYFTPDHISSLMVELIDLNVNSKVIDPTCGSGTFLAKCMDKMISMTRNDEQKIREIKQNQIYGIEFDEVVYGLVTANMLLHKDGKSNIENGDCFEIIDKWIKNKNEGKSYPLIDRLIMNPPYKEKDTDKPELEFLSKGLEILQPNGLATIILPISCANSDDAIEWKQKIMQQHKLLACFTMPPQLFYPTAVGTCIMVFEAHVPHSGKTYLASWKDDKHIKKRMGKKNTVRICDPIIWRDTWTKWLSDYKHKTNGLYLSLSHNDSWLYEAHMKIDYTKLTEQDFQKTVNDYLSYLIKNKGEI